jgi:hypothetical protein
MFPERLHPLPLRELMLAIFKIRSQRRYCLDEERLLYELNSKNPDKFYLPSKGIVY